MEVAGRGVVIPVAAAAPAACHQPPDGSPTPHPHPMREKNRATLCEEATRKSLHFTHFKTVHLSKKIPICIPAHVPLLNNAKQNHSRSVSLKGNEKCIYFLARGA